MNALVEDQLTRLRRALDSPSAARVAILTPEWQPHLFRPV